MLSHLILMWSITLLIHCLLQKSLLIANLPLKPVRLLICVSPKKCGKLRFLCSDRRTCSWLFSFLNYKEIVGLPLILKSVRFEPPSPPPPPPWWGGPPPPPPPPEPSLYWKDWVLYKVYCRILYCGTSLYLSLFASLWHLVRIYVVFVAIFES